MKKWLRKIRIAFFSTIVVLQLFAFLSPIQVKAQFIPDAIKVDTKAKTPEELPVYNAGVDKSIQDYLCTPNGQGTDLFDCVDRLYRFGVTAGAISIVFFIVYAGYIYITGGEASKTKAKQTIYSALTGMAILLGSYVLLSFINPNLVQIKTIQPPIFNAIELPSCEDIGFAAKCIITAGNPSAGQVYQPTSGKVGAGSCKILNSGACSVENMKLCSAWNPEDASRVCNLESAGGANLTIASGSDKCRADGTSFSYGLWQINLTAHQGQPYMPAACQKKLFEGKNFECRLVASKADLQACVSALGDVAAQTKVACGLYKGRGGNFMDWKCSAYRCQVGGADYSSAKSSKFCQTFPPR